MRRRPTIPVGASGQTTLFKDAARGSSDRVGRGAPGSAAAAELVGRTGRVPIRTLEEEEDKRVDLP